MTILNLIWGYSTGGIGKCFLTYNRLEEVEPRLKVVSVCVIKDADHNDIQPLEDNGITIIRIRNNFDFSWMKKLKTIIDTTDIDFYFSHSHNGPIMLYLFDWYYKLKIPFICTCHGFNPKPTIMSHLYSLLILSIWKSKNVKKVICVEQFSPVGLVSRGVPRVKIRTVYNGIEPSIITKPIDLSAYCSLNAPVIITASRLTKIKGIDYLISALKIVKDKGFNFHYFCIGDGEEEETLKSMTKEQGLMDRISFMGYQSNIADWLGMCDIFALPSLEEFHSIAILEAMRAKKAIVATNIGGNPESLRDEKDALLVPSKDSVALSNALILLLSSEELREKLSDSAYKRFKVLFTIDAMMKNLAKEIITTV